MAQTSPDTDRPLSVKQTAERLGVSTQRIYQLLKGDPPAFPNAQRMGTWIWVIPAGDVEAYEQDRAPEPEQ